MKAWFSVRPVALSGDAATARPGPPAGRVPLLRAVWPLARRWLFLLHRWLGIAL